MIKLCQPYMHLNFSPADLYQFEHTLKSKGVYYDVQWNAHMDYRLSESRMFPHHFDTFYEGQVLKDISTMFIGSMGILFKLTTKHFNKTKEVLHKWKVDKCVLTTEGIYSIDRVCLLKFVNLEKTDQHTLIRRDGGNISHGKLGNLWMPSYSIVRYYRRDSENTNDGSLIFRSAHDYLN